jgi:hypothetical protein
VGGIQGTGALPHPHFCACPCRPATEEALDSDAMPVGVPVYVPDSSEPATAALYFMTISRREPVGGGGGVGGWAGGAPGAMSLLGFTLQIAQPCRAAISRPPDQRRGLA